MSFRHLAVICSIFICVSAKSFTLVVDTKYSMDNEINLIRSQIQPLISSIGNTTSIENYVLVPFNDPDVGPVQTFTEADSFLTSVRSLKVSGGHDIPENSLSGLKKALQESRPESDVFLFTDVCAKDEAKLNDIERLCRITRSKVIVFMSGTCPLAERKTVGNIDTYKDVTKVCFGNVFQLDLNDYGHAFTFIKEIVQDGYNDVGTYESFRAHRPVLFQVDSLTRDLIVAVSGGLPILRLSHESGQSPRTETLIESRHAQVVRIVRPHRGEYSAAVNSQGLTSVTIYSRKEFPLHIGFSPLYPRSIEETTLSPLPGRESFIFVLVPKNYEYKPSTLEIHLLNKDDKKTLNLMESTVSARVYITKTYFEPRCLFRMTVYGIDSVSSESVHVISKTLEPQREVTTEASAAVVEIIIPETSLTNYKETAILACKVTGYPQPTIWWEDEDEQQMPATESLLMYPATYISYANIPSLMQNKTVTCKASTPSGNDSKTTQLYVYRPYVFEMIRTPEDKTIEYETEGRLYCEVNAYPEAQILWYYNNKDIVFTTNEADADFSPSDEIEFYQEENALVIKNMTSKYVGKYTCYVKNEVKGVAFQVDVGISGLESPVLEMPETQLTSRLGEGVKIECRVSKGKPTPVVTWKYKPVDGYEFITDLPEDIEVEEGSIKISEIKPNHKGVYKCEAVNDQGKDDREVELRVIYAPKIEDAETSTKQVLLDQLVTLDCSVDAEPKATVTWDRDDGVTFPDEKHVVEGNSLKFVARYNDSGTYRCIAQNEAGTAEKTTIINVLVRPYITPVLKNITVRAGTPLKLSCHVQEASPPPTITWTFMGMDSKYTTLFTGEEIFSSEQVIPRVTRAHAGSYRCHVENRAGFDVIEITVHVK